MTADEARKMSDECLEALSKEYIPLKVEEIEKEIQKRANNTRYFYNVEILQMFSKEIASIFRDKGYAVKIDDDFSTCYDIIGDKVFSGYCIYLNIRWEHPCEKEKWWRRWFK